MRKKNSQKTTNEYNNLGKKRVTRFGTNLKEISQRVKSVQFKSSNIVRAE